VAGMDAKAKEGRRGVKALISDFNKLLNT